MRKIVTLVLLAATLLTGVAFAQSGGNVQPNSLRAISFAQWSILSQSSAFSWSPVGLCYVPSPASAGAQMFPFATNAPVYIQDSPSGANNEIVTPSTVTAPGSSCGFTATTSHSHSSFYVMSGTAGLQEALNQLKSLSTPASVVVLDHSWYSQISAIGATASSVIAAASGSTAINLVDQTTSPWTWYAWNGSAYVASSSPAGNFNAAGNGSSWTYFMNTTNVTLSTGGTTTDTATNVLPANSIIDMVQGVVSTTITGSCTGWELGDATTAARFRANDTTLTAGEGGNGAVALTTGVASATTGIYQASAAKVRITCAGGNPSAGAVRVIVYGRTFTPPTS